jgi:sec-independent protein translocase protein TatA
MYLFILENIGTQELLLIGIVALIFLGPRKMPEYARKFGKLMSDFRNTTNEFKETWQREVNFEEEYKAFRIDDDDIKPATPAGSFIGAPKTEMIAAPELRRKLPPKSRGPRPKRLCLHSTPTTKGTGCNG